MPANRNRLWIPLILVAIAAATLLLRADPADRPPECTSLTSNLQIRVGETLFSVPRDYSPYIYGPDGGLVGLAREICQGPDDPAIEASGITIKPSDNLPFRATRGPLTEPIWNVQIRIVRFPASFDGPQRAYRRAIESIENQGLNLPDLPLKHGFLAADNASKGEHFYIALPDTIDTPDSTPFIISCSANEIPSVAGIDYGRPCSTGNYYAVTEGLRLLYKFYDAQHPLDTWRHLDASVRTFVGSLILEGED